LSADPVNRFEIFDLKKNLRDIRVSKFVILMRVTMLDLFKNQVIVGLQQANYKTIA